MTFINVFSVEQPTLNCGAVGDDDEIFEDVFLSDRASLNGEPAVHFRNAFAFCCCKGRRPGLKGHQDVVEALIVFVKR